MPDRQSAIDRHLKRVPVKARANYLKACSGKASKRDAIRAKCLECSGYVWGEVKDCLVLACPLWAYRPSFARSARQPSHTTGRAVEPTLNGEVDG